MMIYEMRTYYAAAGRLADLHRRFDDHALRFFEKHGFEVVGIWNVVIGRNPRLIYLLAFRDMSHFESSWRGLRSDEEWLRVVKQSEANGALTVRIESELLEMAAYFKGSPHTHSHAAVSPNIICHA
jgi:NIPSNAP